MKPTVLNSSHRMTNTATSIPISSGRLLVVLAANNVIFFFCLLFD